MKESLHSTNPEPSGREPVGPNAAFPTSSSSGARGKPVSIFLSWGGEIYGPATEVEVVKGVQTSWFDKGALYWHEGLDDWRPVHEFKAETAWSSKPDWNSRKVGFAPRAPRLPAEGKRAERGSRSQRERKPRTSRQGIGRRGRAIFLGFAALAVALMVGILLLLMLI